MPLRCALQVLFLCVFQNMFSTDINALISDSEKMAAVTPKLTPDSIKFVS